MEYIQTLRQHLGHAPILLVGATVFALNEQNRLLMLMRTDNLMWGVPGGGIELGEKVEEAARRETQEETGFEVGEMTLFGVFSGEGMYYKYPNGDEVHNISIVYLTRDLRGKMNINPEEHSGYQYFPLDALPENISPPLMPAIRQLIDSSQA
ncbi:MAG: NUDIX domain-containing protein [Anaerolineae bacterium]|jgi:8-oxo-dGTP pyrophosphatase MutT (NUDIX family)|nr:NUDIX domain-containing protein [Anaerolineae bacterium]MBT7075309.1 NUDIX domain-containing protein [Anaerolineae bacterium]MBT7783275.1 NUDIX domain-containing protein [Anaerolineae bacterium]